MIHEMFLCFFLVKQYGSQAVDKFLTVKNDIICLVVNNGFRVIFEYFIRNPRTVIFLYLFLYILYSYNLFHKLTVRLT